MAEKTAPRSLETIEDTKSYYLDNIANYGVHAPRTMGYHCGPVDDRLIRNMLPEEIPERYSVLDVGCGLGQLIPILQERYPDSRCERFLGLDLVEDFIGGCRQSYPEHTFQVADFLKWRSDERFDLVLAAGVLVTRIADFESYLESFVQKMAAASQYWVGFNVIATRSPSYTAKHLISLSHDRLLEILDGIPHVKWTCEAKEVFPGSEDTFVKGRLL